MGRSETAVAPGASNSVPRSWADALPRHRDWEAKAVQWHCPVREGTDFGLDLDAEDDFEFEPYEGRAPQGPEEDVW